MIKFTRITIRGYECLECDRTLDEEERYNYMMNPAFVRKLKYSTIHVLAKK